MPEVHSELKAVFSEHAAPQHASTADVHAQLTPIVRLAAAALKQVLEFRTRVAEAELAPHDHALDGYLERMHQTFGVVEREAQALSHAARELAKGFTQLSRYLEKWQSDAARWEAESAAETPDPATPEASSSAGQPA